MRKLTNAQMHQVLNSYYKCMQTLKDEQTARLRDEQLQWQANITSYDEGFLKQLQINHR